MDKGFFDDARKHGKSPLTHLTDLKRLEQPEIDRVYQRTLKAFRQADDGSCRANALYQYAYDIAGLEKQLEELDIRTRGPGSDTVEKFFASSNNTPLFPVYLASQVIAGMLAASLVPALAASEQRINSHVAQKIVLSDTAAHRTLRFLGEGADFPKTKISRAEGSITLYKYGRLLEATYEAVRLMHLDVFSLFIQRMGMQIGIDQTDDLLEVLINGDGTTGSAATVTNTTTTGTLVYDDVVHLNLAFPIGYMMDHAVVADSTLRSLLNMAEFKDAMAFRNTFQETGAIPDILGARWHRWTSTGSTSFGNVRIVATDARGAISLCREGDLLEEATQIIDKQLYQRTMSEWVGFMKLDPNASQVLNNN
jgi:hypothetical protein